jgi:hypothetical protein
VIDHPLVARRRIGLKDRSKKEANDESFPTAASANRSCPLFQFRRGPREHGTIFEEIVDIAAMKIPFAVTVLISSRNTVARKQAELAKFIRAYAEAMHYFLTNPEGTTQIVAKYTKVVDQEVLAYSIDSEATAMEKTLEVDPKGVELILGFISKTVPQAASAKAEDFYDARFYTELRESGFLKKLWGEKP